MAIPRELWVEAVQENLFAQLEKILPGATDDSAYRNGKTIHIPEAGTAGTILKNPSRPLTVATRTDNDLSYDLDEWIMPPRLNPFADTMQVPYDKLQSLINDILGGIGYRAMREFLINWYTDATYNVGTSGANAAAHAPGGTGNRKSLTYADVEKARKTLSELEFPDADRYLYLDLTMSAQLRADLGVTTYRDFVAGYDPNTGKLPMLAGFQLIEVPHVAYVTNANVVREYGNAGATTDSAVALAVHKSAISYSMGDINIFNNDQDAIYAGDIVSGAIWAGAKYRRYSKKGVVPIIQTTP